MVLNDTGKMIEKKFLEIPEKYPGNDIDPEDIKQLLADLDKTMDRAMIMVLLRTGMRIGELLI